MDINNFILNILFSTGLTLLFLNFKPIESWRLKQKGMFGYFISCPYCLSFWIGLIIFIMPIDIPIEIKGVVITTLFTYWIEK